MVDQVPRLRWLLWRMSRLLCPRIWWRYRITEGSIVRIIWLVHFYYLFHCLRLYCYVVGSMVNSFVTGCETDIRWLPSYHRVIHYIAPVSNIGKFSIAVKRDLGNKAIFLTIVYWSLCFRTYPWQTTIRWLLPEWVVRPISIMTSQRTHGVNLASIPIQILQRKIPMTITLQRMRKKFGSWLMRRRTFQYLLRLRGTFLHLTISLLFRFEWVSLIDTFTSLYPWNRMKNMLSLCLTGEWLLK